VRNPSITAGKFDRDGFSYDSYTSQDTPGTYDASPQTPVLQFIPAKQVDAVIIGWMSARRMLARVICTGPTR
jgi:hypothetical protein